MPVVYLGLGSNLGDRARNIHEAVRLLNEAGVMAIKLSTIIETDPVGGPPQGLFLNGVLKAETELLPLDLLKTVNEVEAKLGRVRTVKDGPRTIDIDILLYDDMALDTPELVIPHPRMREREFVMGPLVEIGGV
jgi:2-amino-4-hydroxy-6-hydroxymethyldihydropteridine diphosphokinase